VRVDIRRGLLEGVRRVDSPNCDERPAGTPIELLVVHGISLPPGEFGGASIDALFTNTLDPAAHPYFRQIQGLRVSSHLLIGRDGALTQYVPFHRRAWHAGVSCWRGRERCNDFSIGIELEGDGEHRFTDAQYRVLSRLARALAVRYPLSHATGHSDIAPGRKVDPGPHFDWDRFLSSLGDTPLAHG
jgi:N-acetyl-anhydromuramoyl-L-alanine amidase